MLSCIWSSNCREVCLLLSLLSVYSLLLPSQTIRMTVGSTNLSFELLSRSSLCSTHSAHFSSVCLNLLGSLCSDRGRNRSSPRGTSVHAQDTPMTIVSKLTLFIVWLWKGWVWWPIIFGRDWDYLLRLVRVWHLWFTFQMRGFREWDCGVCEWMHRY